MTKEPCVIVTMTHVLCHIGLTKFHRLRFTNCIHLTSNNLYVHVTKFRCNSTLVMQAMCIIIFFCLLNGYIPHITGLHWSRHQSDVSIVISNYTAGQLWCANSWQRERVTSDGKSNHKWKRIGTNLCCLVLDFCSKRKTIRWIKWIDCTNYKHVERVYGTAVTTTIYENNTNMFIAIDN
jgi:hypothetical protein